MWDVVRFWLDRGVDGFRLDAINWLGKDRRWPNNPFRLGLRGYTRQIHRYDRDQPLGHEVLKELRTLVSGSPDVVLIGEASADTPGGPSSFYGNGYDELHMLFDFRLLKSPWHAERFGRLLEAGARTIPHGGWPTVVFSNHDQPRHIDRYGTNGDADLRARAAAALLFTLRGTPFLYYGEELGMRNTSLRYRDLRDPYTKRYWPFRTGRDPARTPMQWDGSPQAGFSTGRPWLPVSLNYRELNAAKEGANPTSLLNLYRRLIRLRKAFPALSQGTYRPIAAVPAGCLVFLREGVSSSKPHSDMLVAVNFSSESLAVPLPAVTIPGILRLSTLSESAPMKPWIPGQLHLEPDEAIIVSLTNRTAE